MKPSLPSFWVLLLVQVMACRPQPENPLTTRTLAAPFPILVDTFQQASRPRSATQVSYTQHRLLYIGPYQDTIAVDYRLTAAPPPPAGYKGGETYPHPNPVADYAIDSEQDLRVQHWRDAERATVSILIDTTSRVKMKPSASDEVRFEQLPYWFDSYPVMLRNPGPDTLLIAAADYVALRLEAQDTHGQWRPIEMPEGAICGNGMRVVFLPPKQIAVTSVFIPHGPTPTQLRLRLGRGDNYSLSFRGGIDPQQFERQ